MAFPRKKPQLPVKSPAKKPKRSAAQEKSAARLRAAYAQLVQANNDVKEAYMAIVLKLAIIAEYRDNDTGGHIMRISDYGCELARAVGVSEKDVEIFRFASPMHDIGKIATPDEILKKKGKLTPEEYETMKEHAAIGGKMFEGSPSPILKAAAEIARSHHEKWDGSGYPAGLKGDRIPLFGRILALVDVFDALVSKRCYKGEWGFDEALAYIKSQAGKHFDPRLVNAFLRIQPQVRHIYESNRTIQSFLANEPVDPDRDVEELR